MSERVFTGDCLEILRQFSDEEFHLVYLDPPFFTQKAHMLKSRELVEYRFNDQWESIETYIEFLRIRLFEIKRVMKASACIFFHCDRSASHHIRLLLDEVFGAERFISEIIWIYRRWSNSQKALLPSHQTIFMYSKTASYTFNTLMQPYSETTNLDQILQKRERDGNGKTVYAEDEAGELILNGPKKGVPLSDTWEIPYLNPKAKERTGYPTQKPVLLLERIIELASNRGDKVLDPFCGSGTTLVAANLLERDAVGIDVSESAVHLTKQRLSNPSKSSSPLLKKGRKAYENLPDDVRDILREVPVKLVERNSGIDAIYDIYVDGRPVVIRVQRDCETLLEAAQKLQKAGRRKNASLMVLVRTYQVANQLTFDDTMRQEVVVVDSLKFTLSNLIKERTLMTLPSD